ncbi:MAG: AMP-binding protein [Candidatus Scatovivens sp.]
MRILKEKKIPGMKFSKIKMKDLEDIQELKIDYSKINQEKQMVYEPTRYRTIKEIFEKNIVKYKNKEFIFEKFNKNEKFEAKTYGEFGEDVINLGTGLEKILGLKGKKIVIIGQNTYFWYVSYMSLLCSDAIAVPIDKELPENEIVNLVTRAKADAIIYNKHKKEVIEKAKQKLVDVKYFIEMNSDEEYNKEEKTIGIKRIIEKGKEEIEKGNNSYINTKIDPEEFKILIFTSGTTAAAKGVMLCNKNLAENINAVSAYVKVYPTDRFFSVLPLHHCYESTIGFLIPFAFGAEIVICQGLKSIVPNLKETHPTIILAVPVLIESIYKKINATIKKSKKEGLVNSMIHITNALSSVNLDIKRKVFKEIHDNLGGNIRIIVSAAAPIDPKVGKWLKDIGIQFLQGYGLTETAPISALTPEFNTKDGSVGKPVICANIKIDNPNEDGEGEILISSSTLMLGYYENEEATKEAIKDGWFHSGDIGYLDEDGFINITGRCKNVIVTQNGKNIYPEEIELLLGDIKEIKECMVYGKEDKGIELKITARVIPNREYIDENYKTGLSDEEIHKIIWEKIKEVNKKLVSYKTVKGLEIKNDEFVKTTTMKIKRAEELKK